MSGQRTVYVLLCVRKLEKKNRHNSGVILRQKKKQTLRNADGGFTPRPTPPPPSNRAGPGDPAPSTDPSEPPQQTLPAGVLPPPLTPHLHVHVPVDGDEVTLVLHPPLQLHHHRFPRQPVEEGFGVEGQALPGENKRVRPFPPLTAASGPLTARHNAPSPPPSPSPWRRDGGGPREKLLVRAAGKRAVRPLVRFHFRGERRYLL